MARILMEKPQIRKLRALLRRYDDDMLLEMAMAILARSACEVGRSRETLPRIDERNAYVLRCSLGRMSVRSKPARSGSRWRGRRSG
ncbi:MAG: hypothetical protein JKP98_05730 [Rhodobacteraceae bacterium]|nr:hypothetical protein [Paracoccaceae bacterium]